MNTPLVSIVVPIYNAEQYLIECLDSLIAQIFWGTIEIILVDDGSKDNSYNICINFANKYNNIKVIHQINGGVTSARKNGVFTAKGQWITFVDADDTLPSDAIEKLIEGCKDNDTDIVWGCMQEEALAHLKNLDDCRYAMVLGKYILPSLWGKLYRKELFDSFIFDIPRQLTKGEDQLMNIRLLFKTNKMPIFICKNLYNYRRTITGLSHKTKSTMEGAELYHNVRMASIPNWAQDKYIKATISNRLNGSVGIAYTSPKLLCDKNQPFFKQLREDIKHSNYKMNLQEWLMLKIRWKWMYKLVSFLIMVKNFLRYRLGLNN